MFEGIRRFLPRVIWRRVLAASLTALAATGEAAAAADANKWSAYFDLEGQTGAREKGEVNAFLPILQNRIGLLFFDLRGKLFSEGELEGNFGLGYRQRLSEDANAGVYGFFDARHSEANNTFYQITMGAEYLTRDWDLRGNLYIPISDEAELDAFGKIGSSKAMISGGNLIIRNSGVSALVEEPLWGVDGEAGYRLPAFAQDDPDQELRVFVGGFYFDASDTDPLVGPKGRVEYRFFDVMGLGPQSRFTLGAQARWDDEREGEGFVSANLRIPLQPLFTPDLAPKLSEMDRRMVDPIERDDDIVTQTTLKDRGKVDEMVRDLETGRVVKAARVIKAGDDAAAKANRLGRDSLIVIDGRGGPVAASDTIVVADGSKVLGGGRQMDIRGLKTGKRLAFTTPGTRGTLVGPAGATALQVGSDTILRGFDLDGGGTGLAFDGASNGTVRNVTISNVTGRGVSITGGSDNLAFMQVGVSNAGNEGIFADGASNLFFDETSVDGTRFRAIDIRNTNGIVASRTSISNIDSGGFVTTGATDVMVEDIAVSNTLGHGLRFSNSRNVTVDMATATNAGVANIMIDSGSDSVTVRNAMVDGSAKQGVLLFNGTSNVSIDGLSVANTAFAGVAAQQTSNFELRNAQVMGAGENGVSLIDVTGANLAGITVDNAGVNGIAANNSVGIVLDGVAATNVGQHGFLSRNSRDVTLNDISVAGTGLSGIVVLETNDVEIANAAITDIRFGLILRNVTNGAVTDVSVVDAKGDGFFGDNIRNVSVNRLSVAETDLRGVRIIGSDGVTLDALDITNAGFASSSPAVLFLDSMNLELTNSTIFGSGDAGFVLRNVSDSLVRNILLTNISNDTFRTINVQNVTIENILRFEAIGSTTSDGVGVTID